MNRHYNLALGYFLLFALTLLASSVALFVLKLGVSVESMRLYYLGDTDFAVAKSTTGLLEVISVHTFVIALFIMVMTHFVNFIRQKAYYKPLIISYFSLSAIEIFSPLLIIQGFETFIYIKLLSFILFELISLFFIYLLASNISNVISDARLSER